MRRIRANGITFNIAVDGNYADPWVTLSNSHATDLTLWDQQAAMLASQGYSVLRYDTRGHGRSDGTPPPYDFSLLAADVIALWDALDIEKSDYIGLSLGGSTGLGLAITYPGRIRRLVASDCRAWAPPAFRAAWEPRIETARTAGMEPLVAPTIERWFTAPFVATDPPALAPVRAMIRRTSINGYIGCARALQTIDYRDALGSITCPVLLLAGADDPAATPESIAEIEARIPKATFVIIPKAAHIPNIENPPSFNAETMAFLGDMSH